MSTGGVKFVIVDGSRASWPLRAPGAEVSLRRSCSMRSRRDSIRSIFCSLCSNLDKHASKRRTNDGSSYYCEDIRTLCFDSLPPRLAPIELQLFWTAWQLEHGYSLSQRISVVGSRLVASLRLVHGKNELTFRRRHRSHYVNKFQVRKSSTKDGPSRRGMEKSYNSTNGRFWHLFIGSHVSVCRRGHGQQSINSGPRKIRVRAYDAL